jgi:hypothetical protein
MLPATTQPAIQAATLPIANLCPSHKENELTPPALRPVALVPAGVIPADVVAATVVPTSFVSASTTPVGIGADGAIAATASAPNFTQPNRNEPRGEPHSKPRNGFSVERGLERAIEIRQKLDRLFGWRKRLSPEVRRAGSALRLLFQIVGVAGYAGYFAGMHTFMRVLSGLLMLAGWYAIYWWKLTYPQSADR